MLTGAPRPPGITPGRTMPAMRGRVFVIITRPRKLPKNQKTNVLYFIVHHKKLLFSKPSIPPPQILNREKKSLKRKNAKMQAEISSNAKLRKSWIRSQRSPISEMTGSGSGLLTDPAPT
jgi:hypothetical protein